jgi:hypothetical protein
MGLETAAIVLLSVSAAATVGKAGMEYAAAQQREHALDLQAEQTELQTQQKQLSNFDVLEKTLDAQEVAMTTRGVAFSSPSFNAIQRATLNIGAKSAKNIDLEGRLAQENVEIEKENVRNSLYAQLFGDAASLASTAAGAYTSAPKLASAVTKLPEMGS